MTKKTLIMVVLFFQLLFADVKIILYDCSGSFIGPKVPKELKEGSLKKINEILNSSTDKDTIIFYPIRENSTVSSLNQLILIKDKAKTVFDPTIKEKNRRKTIAFAKQILEEINKPYAESTDIISAINAAASIGKNYSKATIYIFSDGQDNVNQKVFNKLTGLHIRHLFIFHLVASEQEKLLKKWSTIYKNLGAASIIVEDAQSSMSFNLGALK
jgi:hypothetical protein